MFKLTHEKKSSIFNGTSKGTSLLGGILIVVVLIIIVGGIVVWQGRQAPGAPSPTPTPKTTPTPTPVTTPSTTVISPNGGERWERGKTYPITWRSYKIEQVYIALLSETPVSENANLPSGVISKSGIINVYNWTIPLDFPLGRYKIRVGLSFYPKEIASTIFDESDNYFSITN